MTRSEKSYLTKQRIMVTALNLVAEKSLANVKVTDICTASGVSIGSFYHFFNSKEDVFLSTSEIFDVWAEKRINSRQFNGWREKMEAQIMDFFLNAEVSSLNGIRTQYALRFLHDNREYSSNPFFIRTIRECLVEGIESKEFSSDFSVDENVDLIVHLMRGILTNWALNKGNFDIMEEGKKYSQRLLRLILK